MGKNIFSKFAEYTEKPKRNVFDMSFANNFTTRFGQLTPVFCKEVVPGDSYKIRPTIALQMMPMKFPVQTPMRAYLQFYYVRNRNLWKDWMDFIGKTKEGLVPPYLSINSSNKAQYLRTGGLLDYLGVPQTSYGQYGSYATQSVTMPTKTSYDVYSTSQADDSDGYTIASMKFMYRLQSSYAPFAPASNLGSAPDLTNVDFVGLAFGGSGSVLYSSDITVAQSVNSCLPFEVSAPLSLTSISSDGQITLTGTNLPDNLIFFLATSDLVVKQAIHIINTTGDSVTVDLSHFTIPENVTKVFVGFYPKAPTVRLANGYFAVSQLTQLSELSYQVTTNSVTNVSDNASDVYSSGSVRLSALPLRAYESIYNAWYRNPQNNPFILNGVAEYNKYIPTNEGGADSTLYDLHYRNWEYDFLTSAVQSPQQGVAPLVGITMTGTASFADENGNTYYAQAIYDDDGVITGWSSHSSDMPVGTLRMLMNTVGTGISINDLRNVNSLQRWLENNLRKGLKYKDQIKVHYGVDVSYEELDMPEFIGGMSADVNVNKLSQTSNYGDEPLGSFVGQASCFKTSEHSITKYCDEHGFIMGILSIVPRPVYSQLIPKYFLKDSNLDYYFPEFGHIGYQPILQQEVSPVQTYNNVLVDGDYDVSAGLHTVFGYQRAWYDYISSVDEVHGQFRTTFRDFLMNRTFNTAPQLGESFLLVDPDQVNDVFLAGNDNDLYAPEADKIIGGIFFEATKKSPIPIYGIPSLKG